MHVTNLFFLGGGSCYASGLFRVLQTLFVAHFVILVANGRFRVLQTSLLLYGNVVFEKSLLGKVGIPTPFSDRCQNMSLSR